VSALRGDRQLVMGNGLSGKRGAVEWTIGKLLNIVLLVLVLVLVIYGVSTGGLVPLFEKVGGKFDEVLIMLNIKDDVVFDECYSEEVLNLGGGEVFLESVGLKGKDVVLNVCRNRVCNFSKGLDEYRNNKGSFEKLEGGEWKGYSVFEGGLGDVRSNWELYSKGVGLLDTVRPFPEFLVGFKSSGKFVLYGKKVGLLGGDIVATWQDNRWEIVKGWKGVEGKRYSDTVRGIDFDEFGREVISSEDDDEALEIFYSHVTSGRNDDVYWKVLEYGEVYDETKDKGEFIGTFGGASWSGEFNNKYNSIMVAEHGHYDVEANRVDAGYDPWIRTKAEGGLGSSAYGPVQLTMGLAEGYLWGRNFDWSDAEEEYLKRFIEQGRLFLKWGGDDMPKNGRDPVTNDDVSMYDYGGSGYLTSDGDKRMYKQVTTRMLEDMYNRHNGDEDKMWREWRFGLGDMDKFKDDRYEKAFFEAWGAGKKEEKLSDDEKLGSGMSLGVLKGKFREKKAELLGELNPSSSEVEEFADIINGESIEVEGVEFVVDVKYVAGGFVVVFVSDDGAKFGLKYSSHGKRASDLCGDLDVFPFVVVSWVEGNWAEVGNVEYYKLSEDCFEKVFRESLIERFLGVKCR